MHHFSAPISMVPIQLMDLRYTKEIVDEEARSSILDLESSPITIPLTTLSFHHPDF